MIGQKRTLFLHNGPDKEYGTMHVCVQSDSVALAIGVTNCLPCNQPLFACCSHQNSFECSVAMVP